MNKKLAKIFLCAIVTIMFSTSNIVLALNDTGKTERYNQNGTMGSLALEYLVDTEILIVPNRPLHFYPLYDFMVGNGMVHGFFLAANGISTVTIFMHFHKCVLPGWIAFDLLCTHILVKVVDMAGNIVNQCNITDPSGFLFVNDWDGSTTLTKPLPAPGHFFFVYVEIYGNYE
jgi:hypothetical protein